MPKKVLLFTDLGIDDAFAILYTFFRNDIQLVGIVADYGNVSRENAIKNIGYSDFMVEKGLYSTLLQFLN
ncbi:Inosine-uridine preferring nucleoside hydrolase [Bacillus cereus]|nr:Inosine-uridine preferring nucleoside hydrolase [Bacillus cereus]